MPRGLFGLREDNTLVSLANEKELYNVGAEQEAGAANRRRAFLAP
jgi:hypothetical protein